MPTSPPKTSVLTHQGRYDPGAFFDEMFEAPGEPRPHYRGARRGPRRAERRGVRGAAARGRRVVPQPGHHLHGLRRGGGHRADLPVRPHPAHHPARASGSTSSAGLIQRVQRAQPVPRTTSTTASGSCGTGKIPAELVFGARHFRREMIGVDAAAAASTSTSRASTWSATSTASTSCSRTTCARPPASSYVLENRTAMKRDVRRSSSRATACAGIDHYPQELLADAARRRAARPPRRRPSSLLTPGVHNSAYFEHTLPRAPDGHRARRGRATSLCHDDVVYMRTTRGLQRVDVIYRRIDDDFLDPLIFRPDSMLGVAGLFERLPRRQRHARERDRHRRRRRQGGLPLRARDDPLLPRRGADPRRTSRRTSAPTSRDRALHPRAPRRAGRQGGRRQRRLRHADRPASDARASASEFRRQIAAEPARATSRSRRSRLSRIPIYVGRAARPAHVDLRPFVLCGEPDHERRARRPHPRRARDGSLVVNSSQGGGSKDTWVLRGLTMLSRVAESLYWTARYIERAEDTEPPRWTSTSTACSTRDLPDRGRGWRDLVRSLGPRRAVPRALRRRTPRSRHRVHALAPGQPGRGDGVRARARENARGVREQISSEMWEHLNRLHLLVSRDAARARARHAARLLRAGPRGVARVPGRHEGDAPARRGLRVPRARRAPRAG